MPSIAVEDTEKLRAFEQRMQVEGAAAFAAGPAPWEHWDDVGSLDSCRFRRDTHQRVTPETPSRQPLTTRLLTGLAQVAVLALLIGSAGVYLSTVTPEPVAVNGIQPPPIVVAGRPSLRPATGTLPVIREQHETVALALPAAGSAPGSGTPPERIQMPALIEALQLERRPWPPGDTLATAAAEDIAVRLDELPETAAGPAPVSAPPATAASATDALRAKDRFVPDNPATASPPLQIALRTDAIDTLPGNPGGRPAPAKEVLDLASTWVVNLASYNHESMAQRKLKTFRDKGVNAELVHITVNGKPMVRIRTTGYTSFREASEWITLLEERLELEGVWAAKYAPDEQP